ncbi:molybdate transport system permease protein [Bradyrhizobium yuanmingense]|uniref:Molybdate transport system permease protein n=2 Tax=Bradyrhizobium yuanmingense TaxID=108015 RepID=A0ABV4GMD6_9BRAD
MNRSGPATGVVDEACDAALARTNEAREFGGRHELPRDQLAIRATALREPHVQAITVRIRRPALPGGLTQMDVVWAEISQSPALTIELASLTTVILLLIRVPLAWWLARSKTFAGEAVATLIALPLVLPPTALGFCVLVLLGPHGPGGVLASFWGERTLAFTFAGIVVGSVLSGLPLVVQPIRNAFVAIGDFPLETTGRVSRLYAFIAITAPLARLEFVKAAVVGFSNTIGTFGVVMMIGGNIPGRTKVLSAYVVDYVQASRWREASVVAGGMVMFAFATIFTLALIDRHCARRGT